MFLSIRSKPQAYDFNNYRTQTHVGTILGSHGTSNSTNNVGICNLRNCLKLSFPVKIDLKLQKLVGGQTKDSLFLQVIAYMKRDH